MHPTRLLLALTLGSAGAHCGADDNPEATVSTGLPSEQRLSSFDDADAKAACEALHHGANAIISDAELIRSQCASLAIRTTAKVNSERTQITLDLADCEAAARACESKPIQYGITSEQGRDTNDCADATANQQVLACDATVSEYEACVSKVLAQTKQALVQISCANGQALLEGDGAEIEPQQIAECKLFLEKCPAVRITAAVIE
jgi:multidrug resistance efflux pump